MRYLINFAKHQHPPVGYTVEWWESDEHFHWVIDEDNYSIAFATKWQARRSAFAHHKENKPSKK